MAIKLKISFEIKLTVPTPIYERKKKNYEKLMLFDLLQITIIKHVYHVRLIVLHARRDPTIVLAVTTT